jgi:hypothetical protein
MNHARIQMLRQKLSILANELKRLEAKRDEVVERRLKATTPEEKRRCSGAAGAVFPQISRVWTRIGYAKRLLAHTQGDEYQVAKK